MRLPDVNLLIYAVDDRSADHLAARRWLETTLNGPETVGLCWPVLTAFLRLTTNARLFTSALSIDEALDVVDGWLSRSPVTIIEPGHRHSAILRELLEPLGVGGNLVADAHLAAIAIEHGALLCSADRDFGRFTGLRWHNPLTDA